MSSSVLLQLLLLLFASFDPVVGSYSGSDTLVGMVNLRLPHANVQVPALSVPGRRRIKHVNMMLPPADRLDLCSPPPSRSLSSRPGPQRYPTTSVSDNDGLSTIALLVSPNDDDPQCSFIDKARVATEYQRTLLLDPKLEFIIVRGIDDPDAEEGVRLPGLAELLFHNPSTSERLTLFGDVKFIFLNSTHWDVLSEKLAEHVSSTGSSPYLLTNTTDWNLRLQIEPTNVGSYNFVYIWGALLIMGIVGGVSLLLLYCRHHKYNLAREGIGATSATRLGEAASPETKPQRLMTREQVLALPEVIYPMDVLGLLEASFVAKDKPLPERLGDSQDNTDLLQTCSISDEGSEHSVPITEQSTSSEDLLLDQICSDSSDDDHASEHSASMTAQYTTSSSEEESSSSSMCSICILEYQDGERLRMLPACRHVYHTECIIPWLTERQTSCPYCKTKVCSIEDDDSAVGEGPITADDLPV